MTKARKREQPTLFDTNNRDDVAEKVILFALGDFQSRGFQLVDRELALDRLRGAFKRATDLFEMEEFSDEDATKILSGLGASVKEIPSYVATHPFRVTVDSELANIASKVYESEQS